MRPLLLDDVRTLLTAMDCSRWPSGLTAARDALVLLAGFAGALRRSELAALTIGDLTWHPADGIHVRIRASKTDQDAAGATIVLPYGRNAGTCPPCAALRWLRLLDAARGGRPALMRAVLLTPAWSDWTHLYPHPAPTTTAGDDIPASAAEPADPARDRAGARATDPAADAVGPGASAETPQTPTPETPESRACRAPVPALSPGMPRLRAIRRGGTLADQAVTGDALHAMIGRRAAAAGLVGPVGFHSLRAGFVTAAAATGPTTARYAARPGTAVTPWSRPTTVTTPRWPAMPSPASASDVVPAPDRPGSAARAAGQGRHAARPAEAGGVDTDVVDTDALRGAAGRDIWGSGGCSATTPAPPNQPALPTTLAALTGFLAAPTGRPATVARRVRAIAAAHRRAGHLLTRPDTGPAAPHPTPRPRRETPHG